MRWALLLLLGMIGMATPEQFARALMVQQSAAQALTEHPQSLDVDTPHSAMPEQEWMKRRDAEALRMIRENEARFQREIKDDLPKAPAPKSRHK